MAAFVSACAKNMPAEDAELGQVLRDESGQQADKKLSAYVRRRYRQPDRLSKDLEAAGFTRDFGLDNRCFGYLWRGKDWGWVTASTANVSVCDGKFQSDVGKEAFPSFR